VTLASVERLSFAYGERAAVTEVSFELAAGEQVALVGPNGAGKSTLLKLLAGLVAPAAGRVLLDGRALAERTVVERARAVALVPQEPPAERGLTVTELVLTGLAPLQGAWSDGGEAGAARAREALARAGLTPLGGRPLHTLSGGELRRTLVARALMRAPRLLLMDEPLASLDLGAQGKVLALARETAASGAAVIVALHDLNVALHAFPRVLLLTGGRLLADGAPGGVLTLQRVEESFGSAREGLGEQRFFLPRVGGA